MCDRRHLERARAPRRRSRRLVTCLAGAASAAALGTALCGPASAADATWLGMTGSWADPTKWSTAPFFPSNGNGGQTYNAFVTAAGSYTLTLNSSVTINALEMNAASATLVHANNGTMVIVGPLAINGGTYRINGGTISAASITTGGSGTFSVGGTGANLTDSAVFNGNLNLVDANSKVIFRTGADFTGSATLATSGHQLSYLYNATIGAGRTINLDGTTSRLDVSSPDGTTSAVLTIASGATVRGRGFLSSDSNGAANANTIVNNGQITGDVAAGRLEISADSFVNNGTVTLADGTLAITSPAWSGPSGRFAVNGGTAIFGGSFATADLNLANFTRGGGTVTINGTVNNANSNFALTNATGSIRLNAGTISGGTITQSGTVSLAFGTQTGTLTGGATIVGNLSIDDTSGKVVFASGANFTGNASLNSTSNQIGYVYDATIGGNRTITFGNTGGRLDISGLNGGTVASTLTIGPGVTIRSLNRGTLGSDTFGAADGNRIVSSGLLISDDPAALLGIDPDVFINNGTISAANGTVTIAAGTWSSANGTLVLGNGTLILGGNTSTQGLHLSALQRTGGTLTLSANVENAGDTMALTDAVGLVRFLGTVNGGTITQTANGRFQYVSQGGTLTGGATLVGDLLMDNNSGRVFFKSGSDFTGNADLTGNTTAFGYGYNHTLPAGRTVNLTGTSARLDISGDGTDPNTLTIAPGAVVRGRGVISSDNFVAAIGNQVINRGRITADVSGQTLTIEPDLFVNEGTLSALGNGRLVVSTPLLGNAGTLSSDGAGSALRVLGGVYTLDRRITATNRGVINLQGQPTKAADFDASGAIIFNYSGASPAAQFRADLVSGYAGGAWNGPGIFASQASAAGNAGRTGVGFVEATSLSNTFPFNFAGEMGLDATTLVLRFTLYGDTNLDLAVNIADFSRLAANFNQSGNGWFGGDFNYDGITNIADFSLLAANFNLTLPAADLPGAGAVPEPTAGAVVVAVGLATIGRRRRG